MACRTDRRTVAAIEGMNLPWALRLDRSDAGALAELRLSEGIEVTECNGELWLRGRRCDDALARALRRLPATTRYEWLASDRLREIKQRIPAHQLPPAEWLPLASWLTIAPPLAALPAMATDAVKIRLVRSSEELEPDLLLTTLHSFHAYVQDAAEIRLRPLRFAASADGDVLIQGTPLPPVSGKRFVSHGRIAVPVGFHWAPAVPADVLARRLGVGDGTLVLWRDNVTLTRLGTEQFLPVTRSAMRATYQAMAAAS